MAMTEKQGGSDVRANTTTAEPVGDGVYELTGHKWFCSYPPCDVFLTLAQAPAGLSCFLFESSDPGFRIQRLKDKLGTRSLPSSEVEYHGLRARLVGEEGRGVQTIIRMVNHTRLDCLIGSAASMRTGTVQALHHARHRSAFGKLLADQPLMQNVLADLALDSEAATAAAMRVARSYDEGKSASAFRRFATAVEKYWVCKRAPQHAIEALECLGGNGYVEESRMPRLYRDSPLNSIWEGSGNVAALDVLRAMVKEPDGLPAFLEECELARGSNAHLDAHLDSVKAEIAGLVDAGDTADAGPARRRAARARAPGLAARAQRAGRGVGRVLRRAPGRRGRPRVRHAARRGRHAGDPGPRAARVSLNTLRYEKDGRDRADHARPARARQRHHARDAARAGRVRRAGEPRPGRPRDRARRRGQGLLRRLRPRLERRGRRCRTTTRTRSGTRCSTGSS